MYRPHHLGVTWVPHRIAMAHHRKDGLERINVPVIGKEHLVQVVKQLQTPVVSRLAKAFKSGLREVRETHERLLSAWNLRKRGDERVAAIPQIAFVAAVFRM